MLNTKSSQLIENYVGKYADPLYDEREVKLKGDKLLFNLNNFLEVTFYHWHYHTFCGWYQEKWFGKGTAIFSLNKEGKVSKVSFDGLEFSKKQIEAFNPYPLQKRNYNGNKL